MSQTREYTRFSLSQRLEHWVMVFSFITLAVTGMPQKYAAQPWATSMIAGMGGIEAVVRDISNAAAAFAYNLGLRKLPPQQGRYTFEEKAEYWSLVWGTGVMIITGFMLWNPIATASRLPGQIIPASRAAHGGEALLAVLAIIVWHIYEVHLRRFNKSMFTGRLSEEEMIHEHPLELADLKAGEASRPVDPGALARRRRVFLPAYSLLAAALLVGIYYFVTFEQTAITTLPPAERVVVYSPQTPTPGPVPPPTPTPAPMQSVAWEGGVGKLLSDKCGTCHGPTALGGLTLAEYAGALKGGKSGPAVVPGDAQASTLAIKQSAGGHPGQLTPEELTLVVEWIRAGAAESSP
ncbi:MAG: cytochrome b/b6 domain-containing protein [Chloroflexi bacterium]|nr:cytochrome b/b6 domain-containing protein [Chloroflexota bacterium]